MRTELPIKLDKDPLVGVVFELRFSSSQTLPNILPGYLFTNLGCSNITKTPQSEIPEVIKNSDPNLMYVPSFLLDWGNYQIFIGERSLTLSCNIPYQGWSDFNKNIKVLLEKAVELSIEINVERYSLKYTDIIEYNHVGSIQELLNVELNIGGESVDLPRTQMRTEKESDGSIIITQLIGSADAELHSGTTKSGLLIDVDAINLVSNVELKALLQGNFTDLDELHKKNKVTFFNLLSEAGLNRLEPIYG